MKKRILLKKRKSLCSLSIDIEIDLATLSRILNGKQNNPWIISLEKIAKGINKKYRRFTNKILKEVIYMIFLPYADELEIINRIQSIYNEEYILIRLTSTMINKNNLDTNNFFRLLLLKNKIVDYDKLLNGGLNKISIEAIFYSRKRS